MKIFFERQDKPIGGKYGRSVKALDNNELLGLVQEKLSMGPKHPIGDTFCKPPFSKATDILLSQLKNQIETDETSCEIEASPMA